MAFQHRTARIGKDASLQWALAQLGSRLVRSRVDNRLEGDRSSVEQAEIVFGGADQLFDLTSYTRHVGQVTTGNLLSKGALLENAKAFLKGMITIEKSAVGTDSYLGEFGMNLSKDARSVAIPSLEIDQPDCRRGATRQLGRADRRGPALLPRESRHPARRGPQVHRPRVPGAGRGPRAAGRRAGPPAGAARGQVGRQCREPQRRRRGVRRIDLLAVDEVPDGTMKMAFVDGTDQVLVIHSNGELYATQGVCSHEYFELDKGFLTAGTLTCALHLSRFDLENGEPLDPPAEEALAVYPVVVEDGRILIEVPDGPLEISE